MPLHPIFSGQCGVLYRYQMICNRFLPAMQQYELVVTNCAGEPSHRHPALDGCSDLLTFLSQAKFSPIDFDYLEYFFLRYNEYRKRKVEFISQALSFLAKRCTTN